MTELILDALKANNIDTYLIEDNKEEIAELFHCRNTRFKLSALVFADSGLVIPENFRKLRLTQTFR